MVTVMFKIVACTVLMGYFNYGHSSFFILKRKKHVMTQQCRGKTKSGDQCKITGNLVDGYCYRHRSQNPAAADVPQQDNTEEPPSLPPPPPPRSPVPPQESAATETGPDESPSKVMILIGLFAVLVVLLLMAANRKRPAEFIRLN